MEPLKILHLEDNIHDQELVHYALRAGGLRCEIKNVVSREDFVRELNTDGYDLILADYKLPAFDGGEALRIVRERSIDIPFILLSGTLGEERAVEILKRGATDFVLKENIRRLVPSIQRALQERRERQEREEAENSLRLSEERYRIVAEETGQIVYDGNKETGVIQWAGAIEKLTGYTPEEYKNVGLKEWEGFVHPDDRERACAEIERAHTETHKLHVEYRYRRKDGVYIDIEDRGEFVFDQDGRTARLLGTMADITERIKANQVLRESETKFRTVFDSSSDAIGVFLDDIHKMVNPAFVKLFGYDSSDEITGKSIYDFMVPEERERVLDFGVRRIIDPSIPNEYEARAVRKNGSMFDVEVRVSTYEVFGRVHQLALFRDVTARKMADQRLKESEERYRLLVELLPDAIFIVDAGVIQFINAAGMRMMGAGTQDELVGRNIVDFALPECRNVVMERIMHASTTREIVSPFVEQYVSLDGSKLDLDVAATPVVVKGQDCELVIARDVSERRKAKIELDKREKQYSTLVRYMNEGLIQVDNDDRILYVNERFCNLLGYEPNELLGNIGYEMFIFPDEREIVIDANKARENGESSEYEIRMMRKTGEEIWVAVSGAPIYDEYGVVVGSIGIFSDITHRRQASEQLRKLSRAVQQSPASIIITDLNGTIEYVNQRFTMNTGYSFDEAVGQNPRILKSGHTSHEEYKALWDTIIAGREWHGEFLTRRKNGSLFWESATISPVIAGC